MAGWYELNKNEKGQYSFALKAGNAEVVLRSEQYETKVAAENGIASVQKNCALDERYDRKAAADGRPFFIGSSQMYASEAARDNGIASVKTNGVSDKIKDNS
jgi:uncharacterized protein